MINITVVGAGVQGSRVAAKYAALPVRLRATVSPRRPSSGALRAVPFFDSAKSWRKKLGAPTTDDVFDMCVHQPLLLPVLKECIAIGVRNFILPKPIALSVEELRLLQKLVVRYRLKVVVASQWHYASLTKEVSEFVRTYYKSISSVEIVFSRDMDPERKDRYNAFTTFLPHMLQLGLDSGLIPKSSTPHIDYASPEALRLRYTDGPLVRMESDLRAAKKTEVVKIYLKGHKTPTLVANFTGLAKSSGFYTSLTTRGKRRLIKEDVLTTMLQKSISYFEGDSSPEALTLARYQPIAQALIRIVERSHKSVAVVGGGFFGVLSALQIAKRGYPVVIFEKEGGIFTGASLVNQCRVHMGYHYPRDAKTAKNSLRAKDDFERLFKAAIYTGLKNYYLIAKEGSLTSAREYLAFCKKLRLPHKKEWPTRTAITKEAIDLSLRVPERSFDARKIREILLKELAKTPNITLLTGAPVVGVTIESKRTRVEYIKNAHTNTAYFGAFVNAAYAGANHINTMAGFSVQEYQYELCEMPVATTPWKGVGWSIIDGPFFGAMPFGFSNKYLLYDVELSVLERSIGTVPNFKKAIAYYDQPERRSKRFEDYKRKWSAMAPEIQRCKQRTSLYTVRAVLPRREKTDARPTLITELAPGFWQLFSGKITTSIPISVELARKVDSYLKSR